MLYVKLLLPSRFHFYNQSESRAQVDQISFQVLPPYCVPVPGQPWSFADGAAINDGINYLNGLDVPCNVGPGPGNCVRVSCSWNSAIELCNDVSVFRPLLPIPIPLLTSSCRTPTALASPAPL
jgi:hypothetical protein